MGIQGTSQVDGTGYTHRYGVYSETPDSMPLLGKISKDSAVTYMVGCNAWGQATMSLCGTLMPGLLGYDTLTVTQQQYCDLLAISRFSLAGLHASL